MRRTKGKSKTHRRLLSRAIERLERRTLFAGSVVINEIHFNPDIKTEPVEFIELYNPGDAAVDLSGASFTSGVTYTFPNGSSLGAGAYIVVAGDVSAVQTKFGITGVYGPWSGKLSNEGENIVIKSASNVTLDQVDYGMGFPWPTVGDEPGRSIQLINPNLDNNLGGSWRSYVPSPQTTLFASNSTWHYRKGTSNASSPTSAWRDLNFVEDGTWASGAGPIGVDPTIPMGTSLSDMVNNYSTFYLRKTFTVADPSSIGELTLQALYDDGFVVWINGQLAGTVNASNSNPAYNSTAATSREVATYDNISLPANLLQAGTNIIAIQVLNASLTNGDAFFDAGLLAGPPTGPTPGAANRVLATNAAPQMRQLTQSVQQPTAGQDVTISVKATDPDGVQSVSLEYQLVDPGSYIRLTDAAYQTSWTTVAMHDDGLNGDAIAGDGIYSVTLPGSVQTNRRLVRYRITATDTLGASIRAPYADDPQPNFAYFVYNGVPSWTGANVPGSSTPTTFGTNITQSVATYQIIANPTDINNSQYVSTYGDTAFYGTMVYDGVVYDHVSYQVRGELSTYVAGKNKWRVNFNTGHEFAARDNYGNLYNEKWSRLNLNANASPWVPVNRGMAGLDEAVSHRLMQLAGVPSPNTNYASLRVIDDAAEAPADQYSGDMWGLYLAVEYTGGKYLDEHGLEDGNIYEMESGVGDQRNQGATQVTDGSDWNTFISQAKLSSSPLTFWQNNVNLGEFYSFQAINRAVSNVDLREDRNHVFYHAPDGHWEVVPWDLDFMYVPETHMSGITYLNNALAQPTLKVDYANRARELLDLLFSDASRTGGQVAQVVDEFARMVDPSNGAGGYLPGWAELDQYLWNNNPHTTAAHLGKYYVTPMNQTVRGGTYTRTLSSADFAGMVNYVINFMTDTDPNSWAVGDDDQRGYGFNYLESEANDVNIPNKPAVTYIGQPGFAANGLAFNTSAYSDPNSSPFSSMEWRIAEISNPSTGGFVPGQWKYEVTPSWESGEITTFGSSITIPASAVQAGHTYRVRVRMKDNTGRWSHWSDVSAGATQFTVSSAATPLQLGLRVTELNYNPSSFAGVNDAQDMEFLELTNVGNSVLDLTGATFTSGITFTFGNVSLQPGQSGVVVRGLTGFQTRYGTSPVVLGSYGASGTNFSNSGETIAMSDSVGNSIFSFTYADSWFPTTDGGGATMEVINPASNPNLNASTNWKASAVAGGTPGVYDMTAPTVASTTHDYSTAQNKIGVHFSENVASSFPSAMLKVEWLGVGLIGGVTYGGYDLGSNTATFVLPVGLSDGNYRATFQPNAVADPSGNTLGSTYSFDFFIFAGDANHNRTVDVDDLYILATNWFGTGKTFAQGDFNYDGIVDGRDLGILSTRWQQTLAPPPPAAAPLPALAATTATRATARAPARTAASLILD